MRVTISYGSGEKIERRTAAQTRRRFAPLPGKPAPLPSKARPKAPAPWLRRHRRPRACGAPEYASQGIVPLPAGRRSAFPLPFRARFLASPSRCRTHGEPAFAAAISGQAPDRKNRPRSENRRRKEQWQGRRVQARPYSLVMARIRAASAPSSAPGATR